MLSDEERAAFKAAVIGMPDEDFERDPQEAMENLFAAGIARLTDEVGRLRVDGARYRWLRDKANELEIMVALLNQRQWFHIDAMIDAATKEAGNG